MPCSNSLRLKRSSVSASSFTPFKRTLWFKSVQPLNLSCAKTAADSSSSSSGWFACTTSTQLKRAGSSRKSSKCCITRSGRIIGSLVWMRSVVTEGWNAIASTRSRNGPGPSVSGSPPERMTSQMLVWTSSQFETSLAIFSVSWKG